MVKLKEYKRIIYIFDNILNIIFNKCDLFLKIF